LQCGQYLSLTETSRRVFHLLLTVGRIAREWPVRIFCN
jgi:hypothetical protein